GALIVTVPGGGLMSDREKASSKQREIEILLWRTESQQRLGKALLQDHDVISARFSPDGTKLVTFSADLLATVWDLASAQRVFQTKRDDEVWQRRDLFFGLEPWAEFSRDGRQLLVPDRLSGVRILNAQTGETLSEGFRHSGALTAVRFSPDGSRVVTAS